MRKRVAIAVTIMATAFLLGCASAPERRATAAQVPASPQRPHLLEIDPTLPTVQSWTLVDGRRVNVVPLGAYAPATISSSITATSDGGDRVILDLTGSLWSTAGNVNTSAPIVRLIGTAGRPMNWRRVPIKIDRAVIRRPDGTTAEVPADGWVVDAGDETNDVCSSLGAIRGSDGQPEPVALVDRGHRVVVMLASDIALL